MFKFIGIPILIAVFLTCCSGQLQLVDANEELDDLIEGYDQINSYIVDHDPSGTVEHNLDVAVKLMKSSTMKLTGSFRKPLKNALPVFTALKDVEGKCNSEGHAILLRNDQASELRAHKPTSKLASRTTRTDKIVHQYALKHARFCQQIYPQNFEKAHKELDQKQAERVERYFNELISARLFLYDPSLPNFSTNPDQFFTPDNRALFIKNVMQISHITEFGDVEVALNAIESNDKNLRNLMARRLDKVGGFARTYLIEPCHHYVEKLAPDVFLPAEYDLKILEEEGLFQPFSANFGKFYLGWAHFRLCNVLFDEQRDLIKQMMGLATRKANF